MNRFSDTALVSVPGDVLRFLPRAMLALAGLSIALPAAAQFKVSSTFQNSTQSGWTITGSDTSGSNPSGVLTAGRGALPVSVNDTAGNGWLRLTGNSASRSGKALYTSGAFSPANGVIVEFEYVAWGGSGADGLAFFLYDATENMSGASYGGSLGYCWGAGGYLGVGLDAFGNFSNGDADNGCPAGDGPGVGPDNVVVRGPEWYDNPYVGGAFVSGGIDAAYVTGRPTPNRVRYAMVPNGSGGYRVTVAHGSNGAAPTTLLSNLNFPYAAPSQLRIGIAASTGELYNIHEVRNMVAATPADIGISKTVSASSIYPGQAVSYTVVVANNDINTVDAGNQAPTIATADAPDITDALPTALTGTTWTCVATAGSSCPAASGTGNLAVTGGYTMAPGGRLTFTINGTLATTATCGATITNTASVAFSATDRYADMAPGDNSAGVGFTVACDDLAITKTNNQTQYRQGQTFAYTVVVNNPGSNTVPNAVFTDPAIPDFTVASVACGSATGGASCPTVANTTVALMQGGGIVIPSLPAAGSVTFTVSGSTAANATSPLVNIARIAVPTTRYDSVSANNSATDTDTVMQTDVQVVTTASAGPVFPGAMVTYTLVVTNHGPSPAVGAVLKNTPGAGLDCTTPSTTFTCTTTGGAVCPGATLPVSTLLAGMTITALPSGGKLTATLQCTVTASGWP